MAVGMKCDFQKVTQSGSFAKQIIASFLPYSAFESKKQLLQIGIPLFDCQQRCQKSSEPDKLWFFDPIS